MIQPPSQRDPIVDESGRVTNVYQRWFADLAKAIGSAVSPAPPAPEPPATVDHGTIQGLGSIQTFGVLPNIVQLSLEGDDVAPGQTFYYGTGQSADPEESHVARGWHPVSGALMQGPGLSLTIGANGVTTFALDELPDAGGGTFKLLSRDGFGRLSGTSDGSTDDVPEGSSNLYFTDDRADARIDAGIAEHVAQTDPHPQYVTPGEAASAAPVQSVNGNQGAVVLGPTDVGAAASDDTRLTNSREWTAATVTQAEAEAGTAATRRAWTAQRVRQAISAWWAGSAAKTMLDGLVVQAITDGDTTHAPSGDAVFDALAGKFDKAGGAVSGSTTFAGILTVNNGTNSIYLAQTSGGVDLLFAANDTNGIGYIGSGSNHPVGFYTNNTIRIKVSTLGHIEAGADNAYMLGVAASRWSEVFAANGAINTSDAREKAGARDLTDAELAAAADLARLPSIFQWLNAIEAKGDAARLHCSPTVQSAIAAMERHGLDPFRYGFVCYDEWDEQPEIRDEETGEVTQEHRPAGDRYSLRPSELAHFIMRGLAHRQDELERRLAALEPE